MRKKRILLFFLLPITMFVIVGFLYSMLFLSFVRVPTAGMKNTIAIGDHVTVNRITGAIKRGDIIIFRYPRDTRTKYVERVIGLPGETVQLNPETGLILIDGRELPEHRVMAAYQAPDDAGQLEPASDPGAPPGSKYTVYYQRDSDTGSDASYGVGQSFRVARK